MIQKFVFFFFQAEDGIRDGRVTGVQTCALPISTFLYFGDAWRGENSMEKENVCAKIQEVGIVPAVRTSSAEEARFASEVVAKSGIPIVEITMTVPGAIDVITYRVKKLPDVIVGGGTLLDLDTARRCMDVGARFLTSPGFDLEIVEFAAKEKLRVMAGALTPTEVIA